MLESVTEIEWKKNVVPLLYSSPRKFFPINDCGLNLVVSGAGVTKQQVNTVTWKNENKEIVAIIHKAWGAWGNTIHYSVDLNLLKGEIT